MTSREFILDTDILSSLMRGNSVVLPRAKTYLADHDQFTISIITRYEILRGLKAKDAEKQMARFEVFCEKTKILAITDEVVLRAADIYADLYKRGQMIGDADILIAACALTQNCGIVTNNEEHFRRIKTLEIANWLK